jgi:hypothetical protein
MFEQNKKMAEERIEVEDDEDDSNDWANPKNDWVKSW